MDQEDPAICKAVSFQVFSLAPSFTRSETSRAKRLYKSQLSCLHVGRTWAGLVSVGARLYRGLVLKMAKVFALYTSLATPELSLSSLSSPAASTLFLFQELLRLEGEDR